MAHSNSSPDLESLFALSSEGLSESARKTALQTLSALMAQQRNRMLGYQANQFGMYGDLADYLCMHMNNIGDPFTAGNYTLNSKDAERAVLDFFASLWNADVPHDANNDESYWGYVLTMGCTEGNLYGLWNARDYLAGKVLLEDGETTESETDAGRIGLLGRVMRRLMWHQAPLPTGNQHAFTPVAFYSEDTHYSVIKIMRILGLKTFYELGTNEYPHQCPLPGSRGIWPREVPSEGGALGPGSIDIAALTQLVAFFAERGYPILLNLNYGTTFKGAYDDVAAIGEALQPIFQRTGLDSRPVIYDPDTGASDTRSGFWIHVDGALGATYMPFLEKAYEQGRIRERGPVFDFRLPFVHSIATSGHKWIGAPVPTGIYMTRVKYQLRPPTDPDYIGSPDTTLAGSRSGLAPIVLWYYLACHSHDAQIDRALRCEAMAAFAEGRLRWLQETLKQDLWVHRSPLSLAVLFRQPNSEIVAKYTLSCEGIPVGGERRSYAHIYMMEHVTEEKIEALIDDLCQPGAFPEPTGSEPEPPLASSPVALPSAGRRLSHVPVTGRGWR
ncbi:MAG: pyridoxal-dependent decarboxylase [Cyanobacteriota bacterium]